MNQLKISIITITKNESLALAHALRSVAGQTYSNVEHIVVDGDSSDSTPEVLERYPEVKVLSDKGGGLWHALNVGMQAATGDIIGLVHGNDRLASSDVLAEVARAFSSDPRLDFVYGDIVYRSSRPGASVRRTYSARRFSPDKLKYGYAPPHPSLYMRRSLFDKIGLYAEDYATCSDFDYWLRLFASGAHFRYLPMVMVEMSPGGLSSRPVNRFGRNFVEKWEALGRNGYPRHRHWLLRRLLFFFD